jgi:hypothetical protein
MNNEPCTNKQLLDWEKEFAQTLSQPLPGLLKGLKVHRMIQRFQQNNGIRIQSIKDRIKNIDKKYFCLDIEGNFKEEIKNHQVVPIPIDGAKPQDHQKELNDYLSQQTEVIWE